MKPKAIFVLAILIFFAFSIEGYAQSGMVVQGEVSMPPVSTKDVVFKNQSFAVKKIVFIYYQPSMKGNSTQSKYIISKGKTTFNLEVGSKVYLADQSQVDFVMSGKNLVERGDKPYYIVTDAEKQVVNLPL